MREVKLTRIIVERFQTGDDVLDRLNTLVRVNDIRAGSFTAIGAVEKATVGSFIGDGQYSVVELQGPLEVLSCSGNISLKEEIPFIHAHVTLGDSHGKAYGGHMMSGCIVGATFEITLQVYEPEVTRRPDPKTGLYLLDT